MGYNLEQFSAEAHSILKHDPGVEGRKRICALVQEVLKDDNFIKTNLTDDMPERTVLYEDPEFVFCILGHVYHDAKGSNPHSSGRRNESVPVARALTPSETVSGFGDNPAAPGYATRS